MPLKRVISLHPRFAAVLEGLAALVFLWWLGSIGTITSLLIWFAARLLWWIVLTYAMYFPSFVSRLEHVEAVALFTVGVVFMIIFVDAPIVRYALETVMVVATFVNYWLVPRRIDDLSVMAKPYRRFKFLMSVFGVAGSWVGVKALQIFQAVNSGTVFNLTLLALALTVGVAVWGWREYGLPYGRKMVFSTVILAVCLIETSYLIFLWPLGYFASSFILTWVWYVLWLLLRFYITDEGINWRAQRWFVLTNVVLLAMFLTLIIRWK